MDLKQLRYFMTIADEGSISAAARKLYMTQPPLSIQIAQLEAELGCTLFERGHHRLHMTDAGHTLYRHATTLLALSRAAAEDVRAQQTEGHGILRLGMVSSVGASPAGEWLCGFARTYPHIHLELFEANTYALLEKLRAHLLHAAIVRRPFPDESLTCTPLASEPLMIFSTPELLPTSPTWQALSQRPLILYRRWEAIVRRILEERSLSCTVRCLCDDARTAILMAEHGLGVCIAPASAQALIREVATVALPFREEAVPSEIVLVSLPGTLLSGPAKLFQQYLKTQLETLQ